MSAGKTSMQETKSVEPPLQYIVSSTLSLFPYLFHDLVATLWVALALVNSSGILAFPTLCRVFFVWGYGKGGPPLEGIRRPLVELDWEGKKPDVVCKRMLFGKILTDKTLNRAIVKLMIQRPWKPLSAFTKLDVNLYEFWVQFHGLPIEGMSVRNAIKLGQQIGVVSEVEDLWAKDVITRSFIRERVKIDIRKQ
ncbi:kinesin KP1-like isoform X1 [Senna tora]|uniref:Kinesin KP1-like isoform X1 n=1 Tax=Senna tora TaxID=362788 RepID=A0A834TEW1_9FABA|nr:kinesin KP1-like isoform X1 [Senna tora]